MPKQWTSKSGKHPNRDDYAVAILKPKTRKWVSALLFDTNELDLARSYIVSNDLTDQKEFIDDEHWAKLAEQLAFRKNGQCNGPRELRVKFTPTIHGQFERRMTYVKCSKIRNSCAAGQRCVNGPDKTCICQDIG